MNMAHVVLHGLPKRLVDDQLIAAIRNGVPGVDAYSAATFAENKTIAVNVIRA